MKKEAVIISTNILADITYANEPGEWIVVFCHGYKGFKDWGAWNLVAKAFAEKGIDFLKFNFSLNGGTMTNPVDFPDLDAFGRNTYSQELSDVDNVIEYVLEHFPGRRICLIGHSRGGGIASLVTGQNRNVSKLITWAGVSDFKSRFPQGKELAVWKENGVIYVKNGRTGQDMPHYYSFYEDFLNKEDLLDIRYWVSRIQVPHLIIHGTKDVAVDVAEATALHQWNPKAEKFLLATNHTFESCHPWKGEKLPNALDRVIHKSIHFIE